MTINEIIEDLKWHIQECRRTNEDLQQEIKRQEKAQVILDNQNAELQQRINKAIEYIKENEQYFDKELGLVEMMDIGNTRLPVVETYELLQILQGEDK